jgi:predicted GTPase
VDPHRAGHEYLYHPGETNMRLADVIVIPKTGTATADGIEAVRKSADRLNPGARVIHADSVVTAQDSESIAGKRVLIIEDGPTLTHGDMSWGAGWVAAKQFGASEVIDPRPYAVGWIREVFSDYPHVGPVLPAMGYDDKQTEELKETIEKVPCDLVLVGTPFNLARVIQTSKTLLRVSYEMDEAGTSALSEVVDEFLACH